MQALLLALIVGVLGILAVLAAVTLLRGLRGAVRRAGAAYQPAAPFFVPVPVGRTGGASAVGAWALAWCGLNLVAAAYWLGTGAALGVQRQPGLSDVLMAAYVVVASVLTGVGGGMFLGRAPYARRMISWGALLLGLWAFMCGVTAILLPARPDLPEEARRAGPYLAAAFAAHLVVDLLLGMVAQRAGRTGEAAKDNPSPGESIR